jgi:glycosyltransferase involved in cell wall biosynthesis
VHDLVPLRFPHWFKRDLSIIRARVERLVQRSELLIAVSESTRQDLVKFLGVEPEKVRVVHHGLSARFAPPDRDRMQKVLGERRIGAPYFLFVGGFGPVKNVDGLLEAFCEFRRRTGAPHHLLMAGDRYWAEGLSEAIDRLGLAGAVRLLDFVGDDVLPALYAGSTALVLPSWFESFGFPALEAMACGAPVIAARVGALPDVLGDAALYFIPSVPGELSEQMIRLSRDESLRRDLQTRARARAAVFTWERAARQTLAVLQEAAVRFKTRKVHA